VKAIEAKIISSFNHISTKFSYAALINLRSLKEKKEHLQNENKEREMFLEFAKNLIEFGINELDLGSSINAVYSTLFNAAGISGDVITNYSKVRLTGFSKPSLNEFFLKIYSQVGKYSPLVKQLKELKKSKESIGMSKVELFRAGEDPYYDLACLLSEKINDKQVIEVLNASVGRLGDELSRYGFNF